MEKYKFANIVEVSAELQMNDKEICKKCIYYDDFCCRNDKAICVNNSEYMDAETYINAIINRKERAKNE